MSLWDFIGLADSSADEPETSSDDDDRCCDDDDRSDDGYDDID